MSETLGQLRTAGARAITFACTCGHEATVVGLELIFGKSVTLDGLGALTRCSACGRKGCEAKPWRPGSFVPKASARAH